MGAHNIGYYSSCKGENVVKKNVSYGVGENMNPTYLQTETCHDTAVCVFY